MATAQDGDPEIVILGREIGFIEQVIWLREAISRHNVARHGGVCVHQVDFLAGGTRFGELGAELVDGGLDHIAVLPDRLFGEVVRVGGAPATVHVVLDGRENAVGSAEHRHLERVIPNKLLMIKENIG